MSKLGMPTQPPKSYVLNDTILDHFCRAPFSVMAMIHIRSSIVSASEHRSGCLPALHTEVDVCLVAIWSGVRPVGEIPMKLAANIKLEIDHIESCSIDHEKLAECVSRNSAGLEQARLTIFRGSSPSGVIPYLSR